ncbi:hypothetical protein P9139_02945 [Curtobacterium flaccumfaciens]|nr:hypothetical protein P9139_02945 [Curtobacterium flaccumfaciens]
MSAQLDPELAAILAVIPKLPNGGMIDLSDIPAYRAMTAAMMAAVPRRNPTRP